MKTKKGGLNRPYFIMDKKQVLDFIDKCQSVRMAEYLRGEYLPAPIDPKKDFGINHGLEGEISKADLAELIISSKIELPKQFRGYEI